MNATAPSFFTFLRERETASSNQFRALNNQQEGSTSPIITSSQTKDSFIFAKDERNLRLSHTHSFLSMGTPQFNQTDALPGATF